MSRITKVVIKMVDIIKQIDAYKASKLKIYPCHSNRASALGDECERKLTYMRTSWDKQLMPDTDLQYIFDEGNNQEKMLMNDLRESGIEITEQQRPFNWPEYQISGMIDGNISNETGKYPLEIKSMSPYIWQSINSAEDLKKYPWTKKYVAQMVLYLLMGNCEMGIFLFKNKSTGKIKQLNINLHDYLDLGESLLQRAKRINEHIKIGTYPDKINVFKACSDCPFRHLCLPEILSNGGIEFIDNAELEKNLTHREKLQEEAKEYKNLDEQIKEELKRYMQDKTIISCGKWTIEKKVNAKGSISFDFTDTTAKTE